MAQNSKIEWTNHTINLWWGCTEVHAGCDNCYAKTFSHRYDGGNPLWGKDAPRRRIMSAFKDLDKFQKLAEKSNSYHRVFIGSMMDIFEKSMPILNIDPNNDHLTQTDALRQEFFTRLTWGDGMYPNLIFQLLTKRPTNIPKMVPGGWLDAPPTNIIYGTSVSDQSTFNNLAPQLLRVPGKHFISIEPQLGYISLKGLREMETATGGRVDWIIQGGESGHGKRPFDLAWARSMRDECEQLGIPYFFKQIDKVQEIPDDLMIRQFP